MSPPSDHQPSHKAGQSRNREIDVNVSLAPRNKTVWPSLALLVVSLVVLYAGRFIQFDDTSGFGSDRWVMPLGLVAGLLALCAVGVGISDRTARRALGGALAILDALLILLATMNDGFRFIWGGDEGALFFLQIMLGLAALFLLTPAFLSSKEATNEAPRPARSLSAWARFTIYVSALVLAMFVAFFAGTSHFETTQCSGPGFGGECDLAGLEGLLWAGIALVLGVIAIAIAEVARARRQRVARRLNGAPSA